MLLFVLFISSLGGFICSFLGFYSGIVDLNIPTVEPVVYVSDTKCLLLWFLEGDLENTELAALAHISVLEG